MARRELVCGGRVFVRVIGRHVYVGVDPLADNGDTSLSGFIYNCNGFQLLMNVERRSHSSRMTPQIYYSKNISKCKYFYVEKRSSPNQIWFGKDVYMWKDKRKGCLILESAFWYHLSYTQNSFFILFYRIKPKEHL